MEDGVDSGVGLIIAEDMNSRKRRENGITECEKSEDSVMDTEGRRLLSFYDRMGLVIMNGRTTGDGKEKINFVGEDCMVVVIHFIICMENEEQMVKNLEVVTRVESDHLLVTFKISGAEERRENGGDRGEKAKKRGRWCGRMKGRRSTGGK